MEMMYKLWQSSWRDDAVVLDRQRKIYTYPDRVREINHIGKAFNVPARTSASPRRSARP